MAGVTKVEDVIRLATAEIGSPYVWGDEGPDTFDCSGLVQYCFGLVGIKLPRTAAQQQRYVTKVSNPLPGDLVYWGSPAYHTALYIGDGKIISAPRAGERVHITSLYGNPTFGRVPGLGTAIAGPIDAIGAGFGAVDDWLGGARGVLIEAAVIGLGLALVGVGLYRAVAAPRIRQQVSKLGEAAS